MKCHPVALNFYEERCKRLSDFDLVVGLVKGVLSKDFLMLIDLKLSPIDIFSIDSVVDFLRYKYGVDYIEKMISVVSSDELSAVAVAWADRLDDSVDLLLDRVELLYADLGYPECLAQFVRYMPVADGCSGYSSRDEAESAMVARLRAFYANQFREHGDEGSQGGLQRQ